MVTETKILLPIFFNRFFNSWFLNFLLKLEAIWRMQYTDCNPSASHCTSSNCRVANMPFPLSVMKQRFDCGVTCSLKSWTNHIKASFVSPSTIAKAKGNILRDPSWASDISNVPWYLPVRNVPSTWIIGLQ